MEAKLTKRKILQALKLLNKKLEIEGVKAEICIYGGTSLVLAFNARLSTKDVDAVFIPKDVVLRLAESVSEDMGLPKAWMNDGVKAFVSANPEFTNKGLPQFTNIEMTRPTSKYLFAMKCMAARSPGYDTQGDKQDIIFLMRELKIQNLDHALDQVEAFYPRERIVPKTQFLIQECLGELN